MTHRVLVTGAGGYIGSHILACLREAGHFVVALDNFENGHRSAARADHVLECGVENRTLVAAALVSHRIDAVLHFAGYIQVEESVREPVRYYVNNFGCTIVLLNAMVDAGVKRFVFSSSAAVYGAPATNPVTETHACAPINAYGKSKLLVEQALPEFEHTHGLTSISMRYFNAAGAKSDASLGERHKPETHLIPLAIAAATSSGPPLTIYGSDYDTPDGCCVRDYVHVEDICDAHLLALNHLVAGAASTALNLGSGCGHSVREVIDTVARVTGRPVPHTVASRRPGDPSSLVADISRAERLLGWTPTRSNLERIVGDAARWHCRIPK